MLFIRNSLEGIDGKVKLTDVRHFPDYKHTGASIDIVKEVVGTKDYKVFGMYLLNDATEMNVIEESNPDPVDLMVGVFQAWIQGKAGLTAERTWKTLVQCLRAKQLNTIADNIVKLFKPNPSDGGHYRNKASSDFTFDSKLVCNFTPVSLKAHF